MSANQSEFPLLAIMSVEPGWRGLTRLFACLDESRLKGRYAFDRYTNPQRSEFKLFFKNEDDASFARQRWAEFLEQAHE